jgi:hypothetical protein
LLNHFTTPLYCAISGAHFLHAFDLRDLRVLQSYPSLNVG